MERSIQDYKRAETENQRNTIANRRLRRLQYIVHFGNATPSPASPTSSN